MKPAPKGKQPAPESLLKDADYTRTSDLEKNFKFFKRINDPRFGDISIIQNPQNREFLAVREKKINDKAEAGRQILAARQRVQLKSPFLLELKDYSVTKQSELCSSFYILKFFYEYPRSDLRKEIQERERNGQPFTHAELTHLFYQQVTSQSYLQAHDQTHGDIQPLHIGWDRETQLSKLIDRYEEPGNALKTKQIQKNRLIAGHNLYQSPTMYANLKKGNLNFNFDPAKEDAFALGLVMLEAGNGHSVQNIYDASKGTVDQVVLQKHVDEFNTKFATDNALLTSSVASLVTFDEGARPTARQVESSIPAYDSVKSFLVDGQSAHQLNSAQSGIHVAEKTGGNVNTNATANAEVSKQTQAADFNMFQFDAKESHNPYLIENNQQFTLFQGAPQDTYNTQSHNIQTQPPQVTYVSNQNVAQAQPTSTPTINYYPSQGLNGSQSQGQFNTQFTNQNTFQANGQARGSFNPAPSFDSTYQHRQSNANDHYYESAVTNQGQGFDTHTPQHFVHQEQSITSTPQKVDGGYTYKQDQQNHWTPQSQVSTQQTVVQNQTITPGQYVTYQPQHTIVQNQTTTPDQYASFQPRQTIVQNQTTTPGQYVSYHPQQTSFVSSRTVVAEPQVFNYYNGQPVDGHTTATFRKSARQVLPTTTYEVNAPVYRTEFVNTSPIIQTEGAKVITRSYRQLPTTNTYTTEAYTGQTPRTYVTQNPTLNYGQSEIRHEYRLNDASVVEPYVIRESYNPSAHNLSYQSQTQTQVQTPSSRIVQYAPTEIRRSYRIKGGLPSIHNITGTNFDYSQSERKVIIQGGEVQGQRINYAPTAVERVNYAPAPVERVNYAPAPTNQAFLDQTSHTYDSEIQGLKLVGSYTDSSHATDRPNY